MRARLQSYCELRTGRTDRGSASAMPGAANTTAGVPTGRHVTDHVQGRVTTASTVVVRSTTLVTPLKAAIELVPTYAGRAATAAALPSARIASLAARPPIRWAGACLAAVG